MELEVRHKDKTRKLTVKMAELPWICRRRRCPRRGSKTASGEKPKQKIGRIDLPCPTSATRSGPDVPKHYNPSVPHGVVVSAAPGRCVPDEAALLAQWKPLCEAADLIFLAPDPARKRLADGRGRLCRKAGRQVQAALHRGSTRGRRFRSRYGGLAGLALGLPQPRTDLRRRGDRRRFDASAAGDDPSHRLAIFLGTVKNSCRGSW